MTELRWFHPPLTGGEEQGLNEAGVETFKHKESLARETCQNIGDARPKGSKEPAIATFELVDVPVVEFPGLAQLRAAFEACRDHVTQNIGSGTGNESKFFSLALELMQADTIRCLRIGDENTTGLRGTDSDRHEPFFRLLRGQGYSQIQGVGGGTYGIGQRAPFAHSALRTVLYGSKLLDGTELFIAKNILASFPDPQNGGVLTQSKGWWCEVDDAIKGEWRTLRDPARIPHRFRRSKVGTDIWVTGYRDENWQRSIRDSVLEHFFAALGEGQMVVRIADNGREVLEINSRNLREQLLKAADEARHSENVDDYRRGLGATVYFDMALRDPINGKPFTEHIAPIGEVRLYVHRDVKNADMPDRWAKMRKPRILVEHTFSSLLSRYAAVLVCDNDEGNRYLAEMEDPRHETWNEKEARNWSPEQKKVGAEVRNAITKFVRDTLKQIRGADTGQAQDIPFLGQYLPADASVDAEDARGAQQPTNETTEEETGHKTTPRVPTTSGVAVQVAAPTAVSRPTLSATGTEAEVGEGDEDGHGPGKAKSADGETTFGDQGNRPSAIQPNQVVFRSFKADDGYELLLTAEKDLAGHLVLRSIGEDASRYELGITSVVDASTGEALSAEGSVIKGVALAAGQTRRLKVTFATRIKLCLSLGT